LKIRFLNTKKVAFEKAVAKVESWGEKKATNSKVVLVSHLLLLG
jgi:hypothetical protein